MVEFASSREVKAIRKPRTCESCNTKIELGQPARYTATKQDGEFWAWYTHPECRAAEIAWNDAADYWGDEYCWLWQIRDDDDSEQWCEWLLEHHPIAANRLSITSEAITAPERAAKGES